MTELEKKYFGEDNNFIDYFMEVGVEPKIFKDETLYEEDSVEDSVGEDSVGTGA